MKSRPIVSEWISRTLFTVEFVFLATPTILFVVTIASFAGASSVYMLLGVTASSLLPTGMIRDVGDILVFLGIMGVFSAIATVAICGLVACWKFLVVARTFMIHGRSGLGYIRPMFMRGLIWSAIPVPVLIAMTFSIWTSADARPPVIGLLIIGPSLFI